MTNQSNLFPSYIPRDHEQERIQSLIPQVQLFRQSLAVLLYGVGGVGKTFFLRNLPQSLAKEDRIWLGPIDIDDSEFWLLANLERKIIELIQENGYFQAYLDYVSNLPKYVRRQIGHETVLAYLRKGDDIFGQCYDDFVKKSGKTPILVLDTLEAIRGTDTLWRLIRWMKRLPGTLFIVAGRPMSIKEQADPILEGLIESPQLSCTQIDLKEFTHQQSLNYLEKSKVAPGLTEEEKEKFALLTRGHPLLLALTVNYLEKEGIPDEARKHTLEELRKAPILQEDPSFKDFVRQLLIPYREGGFWYESVLRLGIVRRRVSNEIWQSLMDDRKLPEEMESWEQAWQYLLNYPWIRPRVNRRYVTLQDAFAEELAKYVIPAHDKEKSWRRSLWKKAVNIHLRLIEQREKELKDKQDDVDGLLKKAKPADRKAELVLEVLNLDSQRNELRLLQATSLYYYMLSDFETGCRRFLELFDQAWEDHNFRLVELLWMELQRFLPGEIAFDPLEDVVRPEMERFQKWYKNQPAIQYEIIRRVAKFLYEMGQAIEAERKLNELWEVCVGDLQREYTILNLRGNARIRIKGKVRDAGKDFEEAHLRTITPQAPDTLKKMEGEALSELGYFYRNTGQRQKAAQCYQEALRITPPKEIEKRATIQSQYAYVQALRGRYQDARDLIDTALYVRRTLNLRCEVGMALSVKGEVSRYERKYNEAWRAYQEAENIFEELDYGSWLGLILQEEAICLYQACQANEFLPEYGDREKMLSQANRIGMRALELCKDYSIRAYPSALNRMGRIVGLGFKDYEQGLKFLKEGIKEAKNINDGWLWFANLIEYSDLCYRAWKDTGQEIFLQRIEEIAAEVKEAQVEYREGFPDLNGRYELLEGRLKVRKALLIATINSEYKKLLDSALEHFKRGYPLIALGYVASHGASALVSEFEWLEKIMIELPRVIQEAWFQELQNAWGQKDKGYFDVEKQTTSLQALLTKLYLKLSLPKGKEDVA